MHRPPPLTTDCALFLDIDGTVFDLEMTPDGVRPDARVSALIRAVSRLESGAVALITGRAIDDADRLFPGVAFPMAGQHGVERRGADGSMHRHPPPKRSLDHMRRELESFTARHEELLLEDKGSTLAVHYRRAPQLASQVHSHLQALIARMGSVWMLQKGSLVLEIKPAGRDKGTAIHEFMGEPPFRGRVPVCVGDDLTDEFGFAAVSALRGWSVKVGPGPTCAGYRLPDVASVRRWLADAVQAAPAAAAIS